MKNAIPDVSSSCSLRLWVARSMVKGSPIQVVPFTASQTLNEMSISLHDFDSKVLLSVVDHVFLPPKLPQQAPTEEAERGTNVALCHILIQAARAFSQCLSPSQQLLWVHMIKMMESMYWTAKGPLVEGELKGTFSGLAVGGGLKPHVCCIIVYLHFQMSSLCMFELRMPLSSFACLSTMFDSRCSKFPRQPASLRPPTESCFAPIPDLQSRSPPRSFPMHVFFRSLPPFSSKWMPTCWIPLQLRSRRDPRYAKFVRLLTQDIYPNYWWGF
jgi:hypothetical protein